MNLTEKIQSSSFTVTDYINGSISCLYSYLTQEQKKQISNFQELTNFTNVVSSGHVIESIVNQSIGLDVDPAQLDFSDQMLEFCNNLLFSVQPSDWRFYIDGASHSGKSTILGLLSLNCIKRLRMCGEINKIFIFPVNWESSVQKFTDIVSLYEFMVCQVIYQLIWQCPRIFPISQYFTNFLLSLSQAATYPGLPLSLQKNPKFPVSLVDVVAKRVFSSFKSRDTSLLDEIANFPQNLSACFGFSDTLLIYDHIDLADIETDISQGHFIDSVLLSLKSHPYMFSVKNQIIASQMKDINNHYVSIEGLIPDNAITDLPRIGCTTPALRLDAEICHGYPQFLHIYKMVADELHDADSCFNDSQKLRGFSSSATLSKLRFAKNLLVHLCQDLMEINPELINEDLISDLIASNNCHLSLKKSSH